MKAATKKAITAACMILAVLTAWGLLQAGTAFQTASADNPVKSPAPGKVAMLDLGADKCKPCKMMAPILEELKDNYEGRAEIIFIDVWKNREVAKEYGIRAIPTQIFFNEKGEEVKRHTGFMDKETIIKNLSELGVKPPEKYQDQQ